MSDKVNKIITEKLFELMEEKELLPWEPGWYSRDVAPQNGTTGKFYRGINVLILTVERILRGYKSSRWATKKQMAAWGDGYKLKKGEKYTPIRMCKRIESKKEPGKFFFKVFFHQAYNQDQFEGAEGLWPVEAKEPLGEDEWELEAALVLDGYLGDDGPKVVHGQSGAYYVPVTDTIGLPDRDDFHSSEEYWGTFLHEIAHSTGAEKRLDRKMKGFQQDSHAYSFEELVAEMCSCFLLGMLGIETQLPKSAAYIRGWKKTLKDDPKMLIMAAQKAQKAYDYVVGDSYESQDQTPNP
jgi:antirestriction protein ArdC